MREKPATDVTLPFLSTGTLGEAADIITSVPQHRDSSTWQRNIISAPSQNSSTTISTMQQVDTTT